MDIRLPSLGASRSGGIIGRCRARLIMLCALSACLFFAASPPDLRGDEPDSPQPARFDPIRISGHGSLWPGPAPTFEGPRLAPPPLAAKLDIQRIHGFRWWNSRHFALYTDLSDQRAREGLLLLELALPHMLDLLGTPGHPLPEGRLPVIYASNEARLRAALRAHGLRWDFAHAGGVTFDSLLTSWLFADGTTRQHHRYLLLHEGFHLVHSAVAPPLRAMPHWLYEALADSTASHVFDSERNHLQIHIFDRPTPLQLGRAGLDALARSPRPLSELMAEERLSRAEGFLIVSFFLAQPQRRAAFTRWLRELAEVGQTDHDVRKPWMMNRLYELIEDREALDRRFGSWLDDRRPAFDALFWGWEQDGPWLTLAATPDWNRRPILLIRDHSPDGTVSPTAKADLFRFDGSGHGAAATEDDEPKASTAAGPSPVKPATLSTTIRFPSSQVSSKAGFALGVAEGRWIELPADALIRRTPGQPEPGLWAELFLPSQVRSRPAASDGKDDGPPTLAQSHREFAVRTVNPTDFGFAAQNLPRASAIRMAGRIEVAEPLPGPLAVFSAERVALTVADAPIASARPATPHQPAVIGPVLPAGRHDLELVILRTTPRTGEVRLAHFSQPRWGELTLAVDAQGTLHIDGAAMGIEARRIEAEPDLRRRLRAMDQPRIVLQAMLGDKTLEIRWNADLDRPAGEDASSAMTTVVELSAEAHDRIRSLPWGLFADQPGPMLLLPGR
ncbi:MAG: hypothetical protein JJU36_06115 [Phycisphaeraceae bacterium]|nr:hypothetical protein [Phycisphaeraceae bacterium]